jgi:hypothetical protein
VLVGLAAGAITLDEQDVAQESGPRAGITTSNLSGEAVDGIEVTVDVTALGAEQRDVVVRDGSREVARMTAVADRPTPLRFVVDAPAGHHRLSVEVDGDPVRNAADRSVSARFENLRVAAPGPARVVSLHDQARTRAVFP